MDKKLLTVEKVDNLEYKIVIHKSFPQYKTKKDLRHKEFQDITPFSTGVENLVINMLICIA
ncbi:MAG: hypothetical protein ACOX1F_01925 [Erysipelotrichaceae bacterium]